MGFPKWGECACCSQIRLSHQTQKLSFEYLLPLWSLVAPTVAYSTPERKRWVPSGFQISSGELCASAMWDSRFCVITWQPQNATLMASVRSDASTSNMGSPASLMGVPWMPARLRVSEKQFSCKDGSQHSVSCPLHTGHRLIREDSIVKSALVSLAVTGSRFSPCGVRSCKGFGQLIPPSECIQCPKDADGGDGSTMADFCPNSS